MDVLPFAHTPLHEASFSGKIDLAMELMILKPSFAIKLNMDGFSPFHLAVKVLRGWMQRMRSNDALSTEIHVLNRRDREGNTVLHLASYKNSDQAVKQLLKCMSLNRNIQNKSGMTALDVLRANGSHMNIDTEKIIQKAGGKSAASLSKVKKTSVFLRKPVTFCEYCSTGMARFKSRMSDGTRKSLLVLIALIITATYQTAVQPEDKDKYMSVPYEDTFILKPVLLWGFNTIAFCSALVLTFILLPVGRAYTRWYIFISVPLICCYAISVYLKISYEPVFMLMYLMVILGLLVYLLVFYVKWKRTTQKKVPNPKSDLILSQGFKTMV